MSRRKPIVAGQFYPQYAESITARIDAYLSNQSFNVRLPSPIVGGIVPHAAWTFSGELAAMVFGAIKQQNSQVDTFILFGAGHSYYGRYAGLYSKGSWETPLGDVEIDQVLAERIIDTQLAVDDPIAHDAEHSIEVVVPFVQYMFDRARIVPIITPANRNAAALGKAVAGIIQNSPDKIVCIGSTDLTHYGPHYGYTPMGFTESGFDWAKNVNDKRFIDSALKLEAESIVSESLNNTNACGPGAAAAVLAAAKQLGREGATLLGHSTSREIMQQQLGTESQDSVGYAAIVI